jgi:hypothetical protein
MAASWFSFSEPLNSGIDFYSADANDVVVILTSSASLVVDSYRIVDGAIALSAQANSAVNASKIAFANVALSGLSATVSVATERQDALVAVSANTTMTVSMMKFAHSAASPSSSASLSQTVVKIANSASTLSSSASTTVSSIKIAAAAAVTSASVSLTSAGVKISQAISALSSSLQLTVAGRITLATIRINLVEMGNMTAEAIKFAVNGAVDSSVIRTFMLIDGKAITNHNRIFESGLEPIFTQNVNWNNRKTRRYKSTSRAGRRTFSLSWSWLPNSLEYTADQKEARDYIKTIAADPSHHILKIVNLDESGVTPPTETSYNVLVKDYNESLIRRDLSNDVYFWDCSITLEEV